MIHPTAILDPQKRSRLIAKLKKSLRQTFSPPSETKPVFILGTQRSGTTMLMFTFHLHPEISVFDESRNSKAFIDFRLRSSKITENIITNSPFPIAAFKPLADSHLVEQLLNNFSSPRIIWALRNYVDVANSSLRKFPHATKSIRLVCQGKQGGGWFQDGISPKTGDILRKLPWQSFSDFDFACLIWWARNRLFFEQNLDTNKHVMLLRYEQLVSFPHESLPAVTNFIGIPFSDRMTRYIHSRSVSRHTHPDLDPTVKNLCEELSTDFKSLLKKDSAKCCVL